MQLEVSRRKQKEGAVGGPKVETEGGCSQRSQGGNRRTVQLEVPRLKQKEGAVRGPKVETEGGCS